MSLLWLYWVHTFLTQRKSLNQAPGEGTIGSGLIRFPHPLHSSLLHSSGIQNTVATIGEGGIMKIFTFIMKITSADMRIKNTFPRWWHSLMCFTDKTVHAKFCKNNWPGPFRIIGHREDGTSQTGPPTPVWIKASWLWLTRVNVLHALPGFFCFKKFFIST